MTLFRKFDGIVDEVLKNMLQHRAVGSDRRQARRVIPTQIDLFVQRTLIDQFQIVEERAQIQLSPVDLGLSGFEAARLHDGDDHLQKIMRAPHNLIQTVFLFLIDLAQALVLHHARVAHDQIERSSEFVRHNAQELRLDLIGLRELSGLPLGLFVELGIMNR